MAMTVSGEASLDMLARVDAPRSAWAELMAVPHSATASTASDRGPVDAGQS
jgi:hypothetical protein